MKITKSSDITAIEQRPPLRLIMPAIYPLVIKTKNDFKNATDSAFLFPRKISEYITIIFDKPNFTPGAKSGMCIASSTADSTNAAAKSRPVRTKRLIFPLTITVLFIIFAFPVGNYYRKTTRLPARNPARDLTDYNIEIIGVVVFASDYLHNYFVGQAGGDLSNRFKSARAYTYFIPAVRLLEANASVFI